MLDEFQFFNVFLVVKSPSKLKFWSVEGLSIRIPDSEHIGLDVQNFRDFADFEILSLGDMIQRLLAGVSVSTGSRPASEISA